MASLTMTAKEIFFAALEIADLAERNAYLDEACGVDLELRRNVEGLLRVHNEPDSVLDKPRIHAQLVVSNDLGDATAPGESIHERPGAIVGPYKLLQQIGEGGMGVVFMAEQSHPLQRTVALKIIKPGMDTRQVIARFEAERQALALMDHPNIAKVLDAGTTDSGRPYFVMELVKGVPITRYCDDKHLSVRDRLELFMPVCQAVQHAHQKGIIHRDIKPTNVLVAEYDNHAVPKMIDFGVAKATAQKLTERTMFTEFGQVVGTFEYMSPEQAKLNQLDIDTRSDIYSLGVLLYELLTGSTPFERKRLQEAAFDEVLRIIREEEPPKPSTRLTTLAQDAASTISAQRGSDPHHLSVLVRGELDWIVMKCLEKDRSRRYETAGGLTWDIERYLGDEPVLACPPSAAYRFRKFARRNKAALATASVMAVGVLVAVAALAVSRKLIADKAEQLETNNYDTRIALAGREIGAGNVGRAEELLDECPEHLRGWEWQFLKRQRYGNPPPLQHHDTVGRVTFSPDGRQIASKCLDGTVEVRDARTGQELHTLERPTGLFRPILGRGIAYSPDGRYLAVTRNDGIVGVWEATSGKLRHTLEGHQGSAWQVAFSPDSRTLASGGLDRTVRLWDLSSGQAIRVFSKHPAAVKAVAFRPDGRSVLAACDDGTVKIWDRSTGQETFSFRGQLLAWSERAWFSPDARRLAWACLDGVIKIWDTTTGRLEIDQQSNLYQCRAVAFHPDGNRIALAGFDGTLRLLEASTGRETLTIFAHPSLVADVAFSPDGHQLASASYDHTVRIWDATPLDGDPQAPHCVTLTQHMQQVVGVDFSPDGRWLASASWDGAVKLWELPSKSEPQAFLAGATGGIALRYTLRGHSANVIAVAFSPDSQTLASASWDNTAKLWDLRAPQGDSLTERGTIRRANRLTSIAFSRDGQMLAIGQQNGIAIYDPASRKEIHPFKPTPAPVPGLAFGPDGRLYSAGASDPSVKVWEAASEKPIFEIRHYSNPNATVAVSPDGRLIASAGRDQTAHEVKIWDAQTREELRTLKGHVGYVWKVAFSPDGRYLASGSWDSTVKVWDVEAPESTEPVTLRGHAGFIQSLAFSPDGQRLASASGYAGHGEVKVWDAALWKNASSESATAGLSSSAGTRVDKPPMSPNRSRLAEK